MKVGIGYDVHKLVKGRRCIVGGVVIPHTMGLLGHSDADVLVHAIADAILGAMGLGDIGTWFPDTDPTYKDMDSLDILRKIKLLLEEKKYHIINIDAVIMAEKPKMNPHREAMKMNIAHALNISPVQVGIKATTTETLGFIGREEGVAAQAITMIDAF
jgi:2-C-methyl-D-erythritol 2,4-cyclodiphosphate synthase